MTDIILEDVSMCWRFRDGPPGRDHSASVAGPRQGEMRDDEATGHRRGLSVHPVGGADQLERTQRLEQPG
ncbi:hypothetical protein GCM10009654_22560 [Streptomyces hebeiensis]|uniref:Uncharacterized protein n=1 Tax=Streptomyces hebeiensis TaxID=229486 RepID=A0ABN1USD2_9ACTN